MNTAKVEIARKENALVRRLLEGHASALKNWIVSAVERRDHARAEALAKELRDLEKLYHVFVPDDRWDATHNTTRD